MSDATEGRIGVLFSELLAWRAQGLIRYLSSEKFVHAATRPAFLCAAVLVKKQRGYGSSTVVKISY